MTVCVAAICQGGIIFGASDRMLTAGDVEFEPERSKIYSITNSIAMMIAGEASLQTEIYLRLYQFAGRAIAANPNDWIEVGAIAMEYHRIYQEIRAEKAAARLLVPLGLTLDTFRAQQRSMLDSTVNELTKEIVNFDMPAVEAIFAGVDSVGAHLYVVNNSDVTCRDATGFAAIGIGYWHANAQFMFAAHNPTKPLPETVLLTLAAKKRAEVAPGVGGATDMFTLGPQRGSFALLYSNIVADLEKIYQRTRARAKKSIDRANQEVNQYVEQLGKEGAQQQQTTPAPPQPTEEPNQDGEDGEADVTTPRPN